MPEQLTPNGQPVEKAHNLSCYLVGDHDYFAANSAREAEQMYLDINELDEEDREVAQLVAGALLDTQWVEEDTKEPGGTLRQWLAEATEPCWLAGTE